MSKKKSPSEDILDNALAILDPVETVFEVQNEAVKVTQFKFKESLQVLSILKEHPEAIPFDLMDKTNDLDSQLSSILTSAHDFGLVVYDIIKLHLKKDDEWVDQLELHEVTKIIIAIVKVNYDFFIKTLIPTIPSTIRESISVEKVDQE